MYLSARNCGIDPRGYLETIPADLVGEIHIAGHSPDEHFSEALLIDSHAAPVSEPVWDLLETALRHLGPTPVLIERDADLPPSTELLREKAYADSMVRSLKLGEVANA